MKVNTLKAVTAAALITASGMASAGDDSCAGAVDYAIQHATEEKLGKVVGAQWQIVTSDKANDMEKLAGLVVFIAYQRAAYNWSDVIEKYGDAKGFRDVMYNSCVEMITEYDVVQRSPATQASQTYDEIY